MMYKNMVKILVSILVFSSVICQAADLGVRPPEAQPAVAHGQQAASDLQIRLRALQMIMQDRAAAPREQGVVIPDRVERERDRISLVPRPITGIAEQVGAVLDRFDFILHEINAIENSPAILLTIKTILEAARDKINSCATDHSNIAKVEEIMDRLSCIIQGEELEAFTPCTSFWGVFEEASIEKKAALMAVILSRCNHFYNPQANQQVQPGRRMWRLEDLVQPVAADANGAGPPEPAAEVPAVQAAEPVAVKVLRFILDLIQHLTIKLRDLDLLLDDAASRLQPQDFFNPGAQQTLIAHVVRFVGDVEAVDGLADGAHRFAGAVDPAHFGNQGVAPQGGEWFWTRFNRPLRIINSPNNLVGVIGEYLAHSENVPEIRDNLGSVQRLCSSIRRFATGGGVRVPGQAEALQRAALQALNRERNLGPADSPAHVVLTNMAAGWMQAAYPQ